MSHVEQDKFDKHPFVKIHLQDFLESEKTKAKINAKPLAHWKEFQFTALKQFWLGKI